MSVTFKITQREFDRTLKEYARYSRRTTATILNTKAFYIARRATRETPKADKQKMLAELRGARLKAKPLKRGGTRNVKYTLAQLIIIARRAKDGLSVTKSDIRDAVKGLIAGRTRAIGFVKSGWLPAIKKLEGLAEKIGGGSGPREDKSAKQYGKAKGDASPAKEGFKTSCKITNNALAHGGKGFFARLFGGNNNNRSRVLSLAEPALQRAFDAEVRSMRDYIERKLKQSARRAGVRTR